MRRDNISKNPVNIILTNFPRSDCYLESSFLGDINEKNVWCKEGYWEIEWYLCELCPNFDYNLDLRWPIFRIFTVIFRALGSHLDENDGFYFKNLKREDVYALQERVQLVFEGFFSGSMPDFEACFEERNPLLGQTGKAPIH